MNLFSLFIRQPIANPRPKPPWRQRESALVWGTPMILFPALAYVPVTVSLFLAPFFPHARILGCVLVPLLAASICSGLSRIALCFSGDFDVLSLFAGATMIVFVVIAMAAGIVFASVVTTL